MGWHIHQWGKWGTPYKIETFAKTSYGYYVEEPGAGVKRVSVEVEMQQRTCRTCSEVEERRVGDERVPDSKS